MTANWLTDGPLTLPSGNRRLTRGLRMTPGLVLKIAFGVVCFGTGAACLILAICMLPFISASGAAAPGMFVAFAAIFLWIAFLLLRRVRWHND
ncbi:MAG: hypothetical protein WCF37_05825 [Pseudolabrys sp.]